MSGVETMSPNFSSSLDSHEIIVAEVWNEISTRFRR